MSIRHFGTVLHRVGKAEDPLRYLYCCGSYFLSTKLLRRPVVIPLRRDLRLETDGKSASAACAILQDLYYEPRLMYFLEDYLCPGHTFVDVGANIGIYTLLALRGIPPSNICAIEANQTVFAKLERNCRLNGGEGLHLINVAALDRDGEFVFDAVDDDCEGRVVPDTRAFNGPPVRTVPALTLRNILRRANLPIGGSMLIKIDVEGGEIDVVRGLDPTPEQAPIIMVDHFTRTFTEFMQTKGYRPFRYVREGRDRKLVPMDVHAPEEHGAIFVREDGFDAVVATASRRRG